MKKRTKNAIFTNCPKSIGNKKRYNFTGPFYYLSYFYLFSYNIKEAGRGRSKVNVVGSVSGGASGPLSYMKSP